jgi:hypothetical protein
MVLTDTHVRWLEFRERLEGPEGCNFSQADLEDINSLQWTCYHDVRFAREILKDMEMDVEESLEFFREHGGFCDCEILFNVER